MQSLKKNHAGTDECTPFTLRSLHFKEECKILTVQRSPTSPFMCTRYTIGIIFAFVFFSEDHFELFQTARASCE